MIDNPESRLEVFFQPNIATVKRIKALIGVCCILVMSVSSNAQTLSESGYDNSLKEAIENTFDTALYFGEVNFWKNVKFKGFAVSKDTNYILEINWDTTVHNWNINSQILDTTIRFESITTTLDSLNTDSLFANYKPIKGSNVIRRIPDPTSYFMVYIDDSNVKSWESIEAFNTKKIFTTEDRIRFSKIYSKNEAAWQFEYEHVLMED